jgi:hypothetical protein
MNIDVFLPTIYLGDRCCLGFVADSQAKTFAILVDCISRIRSSSGQWDHYSSEDIYNGSIVFTDVQKVIFDPSGLLANDTIQSLSKLRSFEGGLSEFELVADWGGDAPPATSTRLLVVANGIHLFDPSRPNLRIH